MKAKIIAYTDLLGRSHTGIAVSFEDGEEILITSLEKGKLAVEKLELIQILFNVSYVGETEISNSLAQRARESIVAQSNLNCLSSEYDKAIGQ
jgi:hypothetical protein